MSQLSLLRPSQTRIAHLVASQSEAPLTYGAVGATRGVMPEGWSTDEGTRIVGHGEAAYRRAKDALTRWAQFDLDWIWPLSTEVPIRPGALFGFVARPLGVWTVNLCRVVYTIDEEDAGGARFGFAYGTVGAHAVRGEERFLIQWDRATDRVWFSIRKFSRPASPLLWVLGPITRWVQRRFTHQALARLASEVSP